MAKTEKPDYGHARKTSKKRQAKGRKRKALKATTEKMTPTRWQKVLTEIAHGANRREAAHAAGISLRTVEAYLIANVAANKQLRDAKLLWNRREWPTHLLEDMLAQLALGKTVKQAAIAADVKSEMIPSLYRVLLYDKAVRKMYDEARELGAEAMADDIIDISDSTENDFKENKNGDRVFDHEAINRSRLRVDTRKWLMGKHVARRYGDNKHVTHEGDINVNHAAILSGGRKRLEALKEKRSKKAGPATIDNDSGRVVINE